MEPYTHGKLSKNNSSAQDSLCRLSAAAHWGSAGTRWDECSLLPERIVRYAPAVDVSRK